MKLSSLVFAERDDNDWKMRFTFLGEYGVSSVVLDSLVESLGFFFSRMRCDENERTEGD